MKVNIIEPQLNEEQFNKLTELVFLFEMVKSNYISGLTSDLKNVAISVYRELGFTINNVNCTSCIMEMFRTLSKLYDYKLSLNKEKLKKSKK